MQRNNYTFGSWTAGFLPWTNLPVQLTSPEADVGPGPHTALTSWVSLLEPYMMPVPTASQLILATLLVALAFCAGYEWRRRTTGVNDAAARARIDHQIRIQLRPPVKEELRKEHVNEVTKRLKETERDGVVEKLENEQREGVREELRREERESVREELRDAERQRVIAKLEEDEGVRRGRQQMLNERRKGKRRLVRDFDAD